MGALECCALFEYDHEVKYQKYLEAFRQRKNLDQLGRLENCREQLQELSATAIHGRIPKRKESSHSRPM
jgi:uncharacterized protein with PIN domain